MLGAMLLGETEITAAVRRFNASLADFSPELREAAAFVSEAIDKQFLSSASLVPRLADATIRARQSRVASGRGSLVAGEDAPLRAFGDSLRLAATDISGNVAGSNFKQEAGAVAVGVSDDKLPYMREVLLGGRGKPERNVIGFVEDEIAAGVRKILDESVSRRLAGF